MRVPYSAVFKNIMSWISDVFKNKRKEQTISHTMGPKPLFGVNLFYEYGDALKQLEFASQLGCNRVRTWIHTGNYNQKLFSAYLQRAKQLNIAVYCILGVDLRNSAEDVVSLADIVSQNHAKRDSLYIFGILNEVNGKIHPNNLVQPEQYFDIYSRCFTLIRYNRKDTTIFPAGLIASERADIPFSSYVKKLRKLGIAKYINDPVRASGWDIHMYKEQWSKAESIVSNLKKDTGIIWCSEFGSTIADGIENQRYWYNTAIEKATRLGIQQLFYYGMAHAGNPMNANEDYSLLDSKLIPREMFNYIKEKNK